MTKQLIAGLVVTLALGTSAEAASKLTVKRAKREIGAQFRQELARAASDPVSDHLGPCKRHGPRTVTCDSKVKFASGVRCTKLYRARLKKGKVQIRESVDGKHFAPYVRSSCS